MDSALLIHRLQFAFTVTYHYLFPQLTMGLALLIVVLKTIALRKNDDAYDRAARFWAKIFGINFVMGVITGIPMEFQFGTNWSHFSRFAGGVIGQTLAMEGLFAFFLESTFLGLFFYGEKRLSKTHALVRGVHGVLRIVALGLLHRRDRRLDAESRGLRENGRRHLPAHQLLAATAESLGAGAVRAQHERRRHYRCVRHGGGRQLLSAAEEACEQGRIYVRVGVIAGLIFSVLQLFPTGDHAGKMVAQKQPVTLAAMEELFNTQQGAPLVIIGQPNMVTQSIDNGIHIPKMLSFLTYRRWNAEVKGLNDFPQDDWPQNIPLLYYSYHIMVGLGTIFIAVMLLAAFLLWRGSLYNARWMLWILLLLAPFPYIANTAGWMTRGTGPPAMAGLRPDAHRRRLLEDGLGRQRLVHLAGIRGHVHRAGHPVPVPDLPRNRAWT